MFDDFDQDSTGSGCNRRVGGYCQHKPDVVDCTWEANSVIPDNTMDSLQTNGGLRVDFCKVDNTGRYLKLFKRKPKYPRNGRTIKWMS